ncbi:glycosyltransferase [Micromonospora sp. NPDC002411]
MTYVLPLRWHSDSGLAELTDYLRWLADRVDVLVVDGSTPDLFARHADAWAGLVRHLPPDTTGAGLNGKVLGVRTGVRAAEHEHVVIADDDVRYDEAGLTAVHLLLDQVDLVRPQNYFDPLPWHAWWDTGRTLLNRALGADYPGTLAVRRSAFLAIGGYDPDVLFENLELIRTMRAYDRSEATPAWLR